jgi:hypothetical protein
MVSMAGKTNRKEARTEGTNGKEDIIGTDTRDGQEEDIIGIDRKDK